MKQLEEFARISFGVFPTPLYKLENISREYGYNVYIKRDDMTGVSLGGNKVRKLEFLLAAARKKGADYVLTTGGAQSNHAMLTAACANRIGMKAILVLKKRGVSQHKGNQILNSILGADVRFVDADDYTKVYAEMHRISDELRKNGHTPYEIPIGGSVPLGSLGYVSCMKEIAGQAADMEVNFNHIVCTTGSGGTHAGVALGAKLFSPDIKVTGIMVDNDRFDEIVPKLVKGTAELLGVSPELAEEKVNLMNMTGAGYAIPSAEGHRAMEVMARKEGIIIDPVYTGKAFAGLLKMIEEGQFSKKDNILFLHTGGAGSVFALE